jgi:hypothetical protein
MATGRLGASDLAAASDTVVYTCPASTFAVVTLSLCNRGGSSTAVRVAVSTSSSPTAAEYIEYDSTLLANAVLERTGIVLDAGKNLVVRSGSLNVSALKLLQVN